MLFLSLPLWKKRTETPEGTESETGEKPKRLGRLLRIPGASLILLTFFGYCAMETTAGLWASSYLVSARGVESGNRGPLCQPVLSGHHPRTISERFHCRPFR